eukprot:m.120478 g.120478  ORF g.120478 m.120478 type:complete len:92 (+) comp14360_c0_seq3:114-389(+)
MIEEIIQWFRGLLYEWGLANKSGVLAFIGLDNAGKTSLLLRLKDDRISQHFPTLHPTNDELKMGRITFKARDLGGHKQGGSHVRKEAKNSY